MQTLRSGTGPLRQFPAFGCKLAQLIRAGPSAGSTRFGARWSKTLNKRGKSFDLALVGLITISAALVFGAPGDPARAPSAEVERIGYRFFAGVVLKERGIHSQGVAAKGGHMDGVAIEAAVANRGHGPGVSGSGAGRRAFR